MSSNFVTLSRAQFEAALPEGWRAVGGERAYEIIYEMPTSRKHLGIRLFSTVDKRTGVTRDRGKDAIRIVYWNLSADRPVGAGKKILRVEGATTIEQRIRSRIEEFMAGAKAQSVIDFGYVKAVLAHESVAWMDFGQSLLENLEKYGRLTDGQLQYVLGETNPKGKPTFESRVRTEDPDFVLHYMDGTLADEEQWPAVNSRPVEKPGLQTVAAKEGKSQTPVVDEDGEGEKGLDVLDEERPATQVSPLVPLIATKDYAYHTYKFSHFNPVQSQVLPHAKDDCNAVIGANTSAGKTICAEMFIDPVLEAGKRVIYLSPLKSLTQEKFVDWEVRYPSAEICIMTGDYFLNPDMKERLNKAKIITMTSEMLDSRTRNMKSERNYWLLDVGLIIVDESHILATDRGHPVETGLMRFSKLNPKSKILLLSATMPNCQELADWLTVLNGKPSLVLFNTWRPVVLQKQFYEYPVFMRRTYPDYWAQQSAKRRLAVNIAMSKPDEKFLIFVWDKGTGRELVKMLAEEGEKALFHNADLEFEERKEVEDSFRRRQGGLRVMVSTSTTAWGVNLPARNVIITGVHRGINEVDELDVIQAAGRAGRYGLDDAGFVHMIVPQGSVPHWENVFINPRPVRSVLNNHHTLAFHVIAEIASGEIKNAREIHQWYKRSLAFKQNMDFTPADAIALLDDLVNMEMVIKREGSGLLSITGLGKVPAWLYFSPYDVSAWYTNFSKLFPKEETQEQKNTNHLAKTIGFIPNELDDLTLAWALGDVPTNSWGYVPKECKSAADDFRWKLRNRGVQVSDAVPFCIAAYNLLKGSDPKDTPVPQQMRSIKYDVERVTQALSLIDSQYAKWGKDGLWTTLPQRIMYGIPEELIPLTKLPGIGGKRARKLWENGIKSLEDVANPENKNRILAAGFANETCLRLQRRAKALVKEAA